MGLGTVSQKLLFRLEKRRRNGIMSSQQLQGCYLFILASGLCLLIEGTVTAGERPASLLVSNAIERASTIEQPAISTPDEYKAHFIKQGKVIQC